MFYRHPTRRELLKSTAVGFGSLALAGMMDEQAKAAVSNPLAATLPHFPARAKRVIFLFMKGGPSHVDTFEPKPLLTRDDGKPLPFDKPRVQFAKTGTLLNRPGSFVITARAVSRSVNCFRTWLNMSTTCVFCIRFTGPTPHTVERR